MGIGDEPNPAEWLAAHPLRRVGLGRARSPTEPKGPAAPHPLFAQGLRVQRAPRPAGRRKRPGPREGVDRERRTFALVRSAHAQVHLVSPRRTGGARMRSCVGRVEQVTAEPVPIAGRRTGSRTTRAAARQAQRFPNARVAWVSALVKRRSGARVLGRPVGSVTWAALPRARSRRAGRIAQAGPQWRGARRSGRRGSD